MTTRVVLVDDVPHVRRLIRTALRLRDGFEVVGEAADGAEAVQLAGQLQPDIVVLDLGLPDIAGREVLSRVRQQSSSTKIVVFSGATDTRERLWITRRVEGFVSKNEDLDYLIDLLTAVRGQGPVAVCDLPEDLGSVRQARRFLRKTLGGWELTEIEDSAQLVVSELVTNAVIHARSDCQLRMSRRGSTVRIEVVDDGTGAPDLRRPTTTGESGRGVHIVSALVWAWGTEPLPTGGKVVWAEVPLGG